MTHSVARDLRKVQVRTTTIATLALVAILVVASYGLVNLFERELTRQTDARLAGVADRVGQLANSNVVLPRMDTPDDLVQMIDARGNVVFASNALQDEPALLDPSDGGQQPRTSQSRTRGPLRVVAIPLRDRWIVLADSLQPARDAVDSLRNALLIGLPPLVISLAILVWVVVGRALRPVRAAVDHEEQLIADVSHELRSPLAGLRALLETESNDPGQVTLSRIEALATLGRLESITEQLLVLTRQEQRRSPGAGHPVDLDEIVLRRVRMLPRNLAVRIDTAGVRPGQVVGSEDDLASLTDNLLANATRHAQTFVAVSLREAGGEVELAIDDDGPGIAPDDRDRVFDRFTRLDMARSRDQGGAGLGLAIVRAIVDAHGGSVAVEDSPLGGARFVIRLPASTSAPADPKPSSIAAT